MMIPLIIVLTLVGVLSLYTGKFLPQELAMFPLVTMILLDIVVVYIAINIFGIVGKEVSIAILSAMILKITAFMVLQHNTKDKI